MPTFLNKEALSSIRAKINAAIDKVDGIAALVVRNGSAAAPGLGFLNDGNTGIYNPANDTLGVVTNGTERIRVHPSGGVSVGSATDPGAGNLSVTGRLQVGGTTITATAAELNKLAGTPAGLTATEIGYLDGVTSSIQTQLNGKQASDTTLSALAGFNSNGLLTQTAANTFAARSITGTTNQIEVDNGSGVGGNPTISAVVATQAEAEAGTNTVKLMTSQRVKQAVAAQVPDIFNATGTAPLYGCRAWVNFSGNTLSIRNSGNVTNITRNDVGDYTVNFTTAMPIGGYSVVLSYSNEIAGSQHAVGFVVSQTATSVRIAFYNAANSASKVDKALISVAVFC